MTLDNTSESRKTESKSEQKNYVNLAPSSKHTTTEEWLTKNFTDMELFDSLDYMQWHCSLESKAKDGYV